MTDLDNNLDKNLENNLEKSEIKEKTFKEELIDFIKDLIIIISVVLLIRTFVILPFQISGQSMYDSYYDKEFIIVDRFSYSFLNEPKRGDVVVFNTHIKWKEYFIKRVLGLPWETLKINSWSVFIKEVWSKDFKELDEKYLSDTNYKATFVKWELGEKIYEIPSWSYFVMWDNRNASTDSRECFTSCDFWSKSNYITKKDITWKVLLDLGYFNFKNFSYMNTDLWIITKPKWFDSPSTYEYK